MLKLVYLRDTSYEGGNMPLIEPTTFVIDEPRSTGIALRLDSQGKYLEVVSAPDTPPPAPPAEIVGKSLTAVWPPEIAQGIQQAIDRALAYGEAGADILFVEAPRSREELERIGTEIGDWPLMANMVEFGKTPLLGADELYALGFSLVIYPGSITRTVTRSARGVLAELKARGTTTGWLDKMADFDDVNHLVGLADSNDWELDIAARAAEQM